MFFMARSAFWLGLVYSAMEWPGDGRPVDDLKAAARPAVSRTVEASVAAIQKTCVTHFQTCVDGAARINRLAGDAADAVSASSLPKPSSHTLTAQDVSTAWRGPVKSSPHPKGRP